MAFRFCFRFPCSSFFAFLKESSQRTLSMGCGVILCRGAFRMLTGCFFAINGGYGICPYKIITMRSVRQSVGWRGLLPPKAFSCGRRGTTIVVDEVERYQENGTSWAPPSFHFLGDVPYKITTQKTDRASSQRLMCPLSSRQCKKQKEFVN